MAAHRRPPAGRGRTGRADGRGRVPAAAPRGRCAMTATGGGPALPGTDAPARDDGGSGVTAAHAPGLLLVIAAGAAGVAIGSRFPHPLAGVLGALALLLSSGTYRLASGAAIWLVPWETSQGQLGELPGPLAGYPPAGAHAAELAGLA